MPFGFVPDWLLKDNGECGLLEPAFEVVYISATGAGRGVMDGSALPVLARVR